ncbi:TetR/AcrR family transcriptional regulator [Methylophaga sp. OBS4]|uniref:TetR/AcrR family transcriptional regulator n=1 Tax=Methylophaga sp. OBS4 TaxID=2991935 RepID=UPI002258CC73|nr:TetR/AcrR family transcriptional regulator [Methylophaga sp. OBS4]MCX4186991.1 TetR/AcrR family transcriptional regulator [Methylophaga sp. OBS4]
MSVKHYLSSEKRRERTVETVIDICAKEDPATITTGEIAKRMQVTQGALFRHFPSKEAIWESVANWVAGRVISRLDEAANSAAGPLDALEAMFNAHIAFIIQYPGVPRLMLGQLQHDRQTPARRVIRSLLFAYRERVETRLVEASQAGELRPGLDIDVAAIQFVGTVQGLVMQSLMVGDMSQIAQKAPAVFEIYLNGICADAGVSR